MNNSKFKITGIMLIIFTTLASITAIGDNHNMDDVDIDDSPLFSLRTAISTDSGESILKTVKIQYIEPQMSSSDESGRPLETINSGGEEPTIGATCGSTCEMTCDAPTCGNTCRKQCELAQQYGQYGDSGGRETFGVPTGCGETCYGGETCGAYTCGHYTCYSTCDSTCYTCDYTCLGSTCGSEYTCEGYVTCDHGYTCDYGETCLFTCSVKCEINLHIIMSIITGPTFPPGACTAQSCV